MRVYLRGKKSRKEEVETGVRKSESEDFTQ